MPNSYLHSDFPASFIEMNLSGTRNLQSSDLKEAGEILKVKPKTLHGCISKSSLNDMPIYMIYMEREQQQQQQPQKMVKSGEIEGKCAKSLWTCPMTSKLTTLWWIYTWPIKLLLTFTIPNPKSPTYRRFYPFTFIMCIIWIGVNSYVIVWMLSIIGKHNYS